MFQGLKKYKYTGGYLVLDVIVCLSISGESHENQIITGFIVIMWYIKD